MTHFDIRYNMEYDEWQVTYDNSLLVATYSASDVYDMFNKLTRDIKEKDMVKFLTAYYVYAVLDNNKSITFAARSLLTEFFPRIKM